MQPVLRPIKIEGDPKDKLAHVAIVDEDENRLLAVATKNYKLIKHSTVIDVCESAFKQFGDFELKTEYYANYGAQMFRSYIFPERKYEIGKNDSVYPAVLLQNSYDLSFGVNIDLRGYRQACSNDLPTAESIFKLSSRHTTGINLSKINKSLQLSISAFEQQVENWRAWQAISMTKREIKNAVDFVFLQQALRESAYTKLRQFDFVKQIFSRWHLFMLLTNITTHELDLRRARNYHGKILRCMI